MNSDQMENLYEDLYERFYRRIGPDKIFTNAWNLLNPASGIDVAMT